MDPVRWRISIILLVGLAIYFGRAAWHSAAEIVEVNDFEVFYHIGEVAAEHRIDIYDVVSPVKQRGPFLYPPSAAILFIPLSWFSHDLAGYLFTALKMVCLVVLLWGAVRFSGKPTRDLLGTLIAVGITSALLFRPIDSDIGNGQINILVALAGVGGIWLMMQSKRWWWIGCITLAWAVAVKLTPILLLAVPLLYRKWRALGTSIIAVIVLMVVLPGFWFGWSNLGELMAEHGDASSRFTLSFTASDGQATPTEFLQFVLANTPDSANIDTAMRETGPIEDSSGWPTAPLTDDAMKRVRNFWLALGLFVGASYLLLRHLLKRKHSIDWPWDLAMLCTLIVFLSPRAQKAHLVILIVPVAWIICSVLQLFVTRGFWNTLRERTLLMVGVFVLGFLLLIADTMPVPLGDWTTIPARPGHLLSLAVMIFLQFRLCDTKAKPAGDMNSTAERN